MAGRERGVLEKRLCTPMEENGEGSSEDGEEGAGKKQGSEQLKQIGRPPADRRWPVLALHHDQGLCGNLEAGEGTGVSGHR